MRRAARQVPPRSAAALALLLTFLSPLPALPGDEGRADLLVRQGVGLLGSGKLEEARGYALRALEFDGASSDARTLLGRIDVLEGRQDRAALELEQAVTAGRFRVFDERSSRRELAESLLRMRRYGEALAALGTLRQGDADESSLLLASRARRGLGELEESGVVAREAIRRFPDSADAYILLAAAERSLNRFGEARVVMETARRRLPSNAAVALEALRDEPTPSGRLPLLASYYALAARPRDLDVAAAVLGARYDTVQAGLYVDRFVEAGGLGHQERLDELRALVSAEHRKKLDDEAAAWSGDRVSDADGDGYAENRYRFEDGKLAAWGADPDQDGLDEAAVTFEAGGGAREAIFRGWPPSTPLESAVGRQIRITYSDYPWVETVGYEQASLRRVYDLVPRSFRLRLYAGSLSEPVRLPDDFRLPDEADARASAWAYRDFRLPGGAEYARCLLFQGRLTSAESDEDGDESVDHRVSFRDGIAFEGARDLDGDGTFETTERFAQGKLARLAFDSDGDGRADYERSYAEPGSEAWDLDSDGVPDLLRSEGILRILQGLRSPEGGVP